LIVNSRLQVGAMLAVRLHRPTYGQHSPGLRSAAECYRRGFQTTTAVLFGTTARSRR
jgi:hypothetical protein